MKLLLSFDIEEFDTLQEYVNVDDIEIYDISYKGCLKILELLDRNNIKATLFVTTSFALRYKDLIKKISKKHEVAFHGYYHKNRNESLDELKKGKNILEKIIGRQVKGFRSPRLKMCGFEDLKSLGIKYDSSLHPTWIPGHYFNLFKRNKVFIENGVIEVPISVGFFRLPFYWVFFRNLPLIYSKICTMFCRGHVNILFHPWEFVELKYKIPWYLKRNTGPRLVSKLDCYLKWLKKKGYNAFEFREFLEPEDKKWRLYEPTNFRNRIRKKIN